MVPLLLLDLFVSLARYSSTAMIIEAISTLKDPNGCNISAIYRFIEVEVPLSSCYRCCFIFFRYGLAWKTFL